MVKKQGFDAGGRMPDAPEKAESRRQNPEARMKRRRTASTDFAFLLNSGS
jgi:hypothetical protein